MKQNLDGQNEVRAYLLGALDDPDKMRQIEERLMLEDNFGEELSNAEDEMIEKYLDGELSETEKEQFESFFLSTPERAKQFRVSRNLRKYASAAEPVAEPVPDPGRSFDWRHYFSLPVLRFATVLLVVIGLGYGVWRVGFYQSDVDRGLAELTLAYKGDRPFKARITGFDYSAPPSETRGPGDKEKPDTIERQRAAAIIAKAVSDNRNAESLYASGKASLVKKELEKAISLFEEAASLNPANANLQSDLGAAYLEMGRDILNRDTTKGLELLEKSQKHLEKAIELNPKVLEPHFNLALALEALVKPDRAKKAWNDYIALDPASPWTEEARSRLKELDEKP